MCFFLSKTKTLFWPNGKTAKEIVAMEKTHKIFLKKGEIKGWSMDCDVWLIIVDCKIWILWVIILQSYCMMG